MHTYFFMVPHISGAEKIIFTESELCAHISRTHTGSHFVCVHGLDEHSILLSTIERAEMRIASNRGREKRGEKTQREQEVAERERGRIQERGMNEQMIKGKNEKAESR